VPEQCGIVQLFSQGVALRQIPSSIVRGRLTDGQDKQELQIFGRLYCVAAVVRQAARCFANALALKLIGEETSSRIRPNSAEAIGE
jgi:hypothetical protein